ncbi:MAG: histidine phosphatase family protein [Firmicutes bacterium]|nr:histidine phosphatase family protein [Bacillota bacterium]
MIYIVRHGQTDYNKNGRYAGRIDVPLNDIGRDQAKIVKEKLKDIKFDKIFCSPLVRAYETAQIISDNNIIKDDRIIERSNGDLEGKLKTEINENIDFNDPEEQRFNIESIIDFRKRIKDFFDEITTLYKDKNVLVVTHAGVGIYSRCYFEGEPLDKDFRKYKIKNCEIIKYDN